MNILITAATKFELKPFLARISTDLPNLNDSENIQYNNLSVDILISGIGLVHTSYHLTRALNRKSYDLVINAGIAGSFNPDLKIGEVVLVEQEEFGDLGIENINGFETIFESGLMKKDVFPFENGKLKWILPKNIQLSKLKPVKGLSSNTAHGKESSIKQIEQKFNADIETMEGAAFFYVCLMENVNFIQIRSISNYVENRDTSKWDIPLALENLTVFMIRLLNDLTSNVDTNSTS